MPRPAETYQSGISHMTKHEGSYFFYSTTENLLIETKDFNTFIPITPPVEGNGGRQSDQYIVTKHGHIIISNELGGVYYFIP
jgi:hypothetical protein